MTAAFPLPASHSWPKQGRSTLLHAACLAHAAIACSRGWCADSPLRRVQLQGRLERAEAEIALLREELRIKDARMGRIEPHRRPYYPPAERMAILELSGTWTACGD